MLHLMLPSHSSSSNERMIFKMAKATQQSERI